MVQNDGCIDLTQLTSPDIKAALDSGYDTLVFAVGSNEQHGPCLPVSTDTILGDKIASAVAEKLGSALKGPTINIGCSEHHMNFPGTISLRRKTLQAVVKDYIASVVRHGFSRVVVIPAHGGNFGPINEISEEIQQSYSGVNIIMYTALDGFIEMLFETGERLDVSNEESGAHAGEAEVSMMLWAREDLVREEKIPEAKGFIGAFTEAEAKKIFMEGIEALSSIGVIGSPTKSSRKHGEQYIEALATGLVNYIKSKK